jgi:hypothetical protein
MSDFDLLQLQVGGAGMVALVLSGAWLFFQTALRRFKPTRRDALFMGLAAIALMGLLQLWLLVSDALHDKYPTVPLEALHLAFPVAAGAMLVRFVLSEEAALYFAICFAALVGIMLGNSLPAFLFSLVTSLVAADRMSRVRDRAGLFRAGALGGLIGIGMVLFMGLASGRGVGSELAWSGCWRRSRWPMAAPMLVLTLTPVAEAAFGYASDLKLLELANLNHPALKELVLQAPGTYHHSIIMGSLVESGGGVDRRQPAARAKLRVLPRHRQGSEPGLLRREPEGHQRARRARAADERRHHQAPRHRRPRDGAPVQAAPPRGRRDSAAPRHPPRRLLLPQGPARARGQGERAAHRRVDLPLPRARARSSRETALVHDRRRLRSGQPLDA